MQTVLGVALACLASVFFNAAIAIQALEARSQPAELGLSAQLLVELFRRPRWFLAWLLGAAAFPLQTVALRFAPLTAGQPAGAPGRLLFLSRGRRTSCGRAGR